MARNMVTRKKNFETPHVVKIWSKSAKIDFFKKKHSYQARSAVIIVLMDSTSKMASYTAFKKLSTSKTWKWQPKWWAKIGAQDIQNMAELSKNLITALKLFL